MALDLADLPVERLEHRYVFLIDRAKAHLNARESGGLHSPMAWREQACAATLMRDAGCIALILGKPAEASANLLGAGHLLLKLGLPAGAALVLLGNPREGSLIGEAFAPLFADTAWQRSRQEHSHRDDARTRLDATHEPRQMLGLGQAQRIALAFGESGLFGANGEGDDVQLRYRLERRGGHPVGITGLSIEAYLALADQLSVPQQIAPKPDFLEVPRSLELLFALRAEGLQAARKDRYHWQLVPRPAELIDLDSLILMLVALGQEQSSLLERALPADAPALTDMPFRAADLLFRYHRDMPRQ